MANAVAGKRSEIGSLRADCTNAVIRKTARIKPNAVISFFNS